MVQYPRFLPKDSQTVNLKRWSAVLLALLCLLMGACGPKETAQAIQSESIPTAEPTQAPLTAAPTAEPQRQTLVVAANTPEPTQTPQPSPTPMPQPPPGDSRNEKDADA